MTQDDIIRMAQEAGFVEYELDDGTTNAFDRRYQRFAELVAADELQAALNAPPLPVQPEQRKPLTDEEIQIIWNVAASAIPGWSRHIAYARAIEAAHGIKEQSWPVQRPWQGLTDDDWAKIEDMPDTFDQGVAWAQARLRERNNG